MRISALLLLLATLPAAAADQAVCKAGEYYAADHTCQPVQLAHSVFQPNTCYSIDWGAPLALGAKQWGLFYGAVTNRTGVRSCEAQGYSEDIFFLRGNSPIYGRRHGKVVLTSLDLARRFGVGAMRRDVAQPCAGKPECSGYNIGEPAVLQLPQQWLMVFDSQSCLQAQHNDQFGLIVAASHRPDGGWRILRRLDGEIPGKPPLRFPRMFLDARSGKAYVIYQDAEIKTYAAELRWQQGQLHTAAANQGQPLLPQWAVNTMEVFYVPQRQAWFALTDQHGQGDYESLNTLWLLGPSADPWSFDWQRRRPLLRRADWYSGHLRAPATVVRDGRVHVAFWGKALGGHDSSCSEPRSVKMGWLDNIQLPTDDVAAVDARVDAGALLLTPPSPGVPQQRLFVAIVRAGQYRVFRAGQWEALAEGGVFPSLPADTQRVPLPADLGAEDVIYVARGRDINDVVFNQRYQQVKR